MAKFGFDSAEVDVNATGSYDPLPDGEYTLMALEAEEKNTAAGTGSYIKAKFEVIKGDHKGRWVWMNFNINNPSEKAQKIGRQQLVAWATACGKPDADDTDKLINKPFNAAVGLEPVGATPRATRSKLSCLTLPTPRPLRLSQPQPKPRLRLRLVNQPTLGIK